ncbi:MAG: PAS domain S-box protein [Planctomycetes bacterium]|nr:PAS domain S-box protein [Planctomycetota bacterium]
MPVNVSSKRRIFIRILAILLMLLVGSAYCEFVRSYTMTQPMPDLATYRAVIVATTVAVLCFVIFVALLAARLIRPDHPAGRNFPPEFYAALESSGHILYKYDVQKNHFEYISPNVREILGFAPEYFNGKSFDELSQGIHPEDRLMLQKFLEGGAAAHKGGAATAAVEYRRMTADGRYCWVADRCNLHFDNAGRLTAIVGSMYDITRRKEDQLKIGELQGRHRDLFESIGDAIFIGDGGGRFLDVNPAACRQLGCDRRELLNMAVQDIIPPQEMGTLGRTMDAVLKTGKAELESVHVRKDGVRVPVELRISLIDYAGKPAFLAVARDITDRRAAQEAVRQSEERYRQLIETAYEGVAVIGQDKFLFANESTSRISGYSVQELAGMHPMEIIHPEDREMVRKYHDDRLAGLPAPSRYEFQLVRKDGQVVWVHISAIKINWQGQPASLGLLLDVTDLINAQDALQKGQEYLEKRVKERTAELARANRELEAEIEERRRMERILQDVRRTLLVAREDERRQVAMDLHDSIGQKVIAMNLSLQSILAGKSSLGDGPVGRTLSDLAGNCTSLIREIRQISHGLYPPTLESLGLANALAQMIHDAQAAGRIRLDCPGDLQRMRLAPRQEIQLFRIAQEALANALKHSQAGHVILSLARKDDRIILAVSDDGKGFDPGGTAGGMGLNTMRDRAQSCGGALRIDSTPGRTVIEAEVPANVSDY